MSSNVVDGFLQLMLDGDSSDLYLTVGSQPVFRSNRGIKKVGEVLKSEDIILILSELLNSNQLAEFNDNMELNTVYSWNNTGRFRISAFIQQGDPGLVIRQINTIIPTFEQLQLGPIYSEMAMKKRGLVLLVGPTGSGKSSSLAAMVGYRNKNSEGHIITVEDPIEFIHQHDGCIITQRDVGVDTESFAIALKNALRQRPDVVLIGEIRDRETMEHAIKFSETGHLCLATLHANNSSQAIERIVNLFPEEKHKQLLMNLSLNLCGILSQRLVKSRMGGKCIVSEVLINIGLMRDLIRDSKITEITDLMERSVDVGMQTFDYDLLARFIRGEITEDVALSESDNPQNLKLRIRRMTAPKPEDVPLSISSDSTSVNALDMSDDEQF